MRFAEDNVFAIRGIKGRFRVAHPANIELIVPPDHHHCGGSTRIRYSLLGKEVKEIIIGPDESLLEEGAEGVLRLPRSCRI